MKFNFIKQSGSITNAVDFLQTKTISHWLFHIAGYLFSLILLIITYSDVNILRHHNKVRAIIQLVKW